MLDILGKMAGGLVLGLGGIGSCMGILAAGTAAAAAWANEGKAGKNPSFQYILMIAAPISQTLYSFILMLAMRDIASTPANTMLMFGVAIGCGAIELSSAYCQGLIGAAGVRCLNENGGKGFAFLIIALGIIETVGIFGLAFGSILLKSAAVVTVGG
ncbi:MAG: hypothetical protein WA705_10530 [Candidatus Ozemobacteraceae bacterium]